MMKDKWMKYLRKAVLFTMLLHAGWCVSGGKG